MKHTKSTNNGMTSIQVDFDNYKYESDSLQVLNERIVATKVIGEEQVGPTADPVFANNSWETISQISQEITQMSETGADLYTAIESKYGWKVGDTKEFTIESGENAGTYTAQIWDFNVDTDKDGNKLGIRLGTVELLKTSYPMEFGGQTNEGGFGKTSLALEILPNQVYEALPKDLYSVVKETKVTYHDGQGASITQQTDYYKLFLMSEYEQYGTEKYSTKDGVFLKYWQEHNTNDDRVKADLGSTDSNFYWSRSSDKDYSDTFIGTNYDGSLYYREPAVHFGVCLTFNV